jgi:hypothetical protein
MFFGKKASKPPVDTVNEMVDWELFRPVLEKRNSQSQHSCFPEQHPGGQFLVAGQSLPGRRRLGAEVLQMAHFDAQPSYSLPPHPPSEIIGGLVAQGA